VYFIYGKNYKEVPMKFMDSGRISFPVQHSD